MASDKRQAASGAMMSNVGNPQVYEDGDQRCVYLRSSSVCGAERLTRVTRISAADQREEMERQKDELASGQKNAHRWDDPK